MSTSDDFIHSSGLIFLVPFLAAREAVAPLANNPIMLVSGMDTSYTKISPLMMILSIVLE